MVEYPGWEHHELHVQELLKLDSTPASGSQFYATGDAVDNRHMLDSRFPILADAKYTEKLSFSLNNHFLVDQTDKAQALGKRFVMPVRFWHRGALHPQDYAVLGLDDLAELLTMAQEALQCPECGAERRLVPCHHGRST